MHTLFIGTVWPEPSASAAGTRILQLISGFQQFSKVSFVSAADFNSASEELKKLHVSIDQIELNSDSFQSKLSEIQPDIVVYDRFMTEEQYSWRVREYSSNVYHILDTEDLHCLRKFREEYVLPNQLEQQFDYTRLIELDITKRELAAIYRCDLSLIISQFEHNLLLSQFQVPKSLLYYLPIGIDQIIGRKVGGESKFISIGNFRHPPNLKASRMLVKEIWPLIRKQLPTATLELYGGYPTKEVFQWDNAQKGVIVKGNHPQLSEIFQSSSILLAPLQFGAGLKGKIIDAIQFQTPFVTTDIGMEGIPLQANFSYLAKTKEEFITNAVHIFQQMKSQYEFKLELKENWNSKVLLSDFQEFIQKDHTQFLARRSQNSIGAILNYELFQANKYLSKWISLKNEKN